MHPIVNIKTRSIVITGSTRGIGYSLATAFLERGCTVTISGRAQESVDEAVAKQGVRYSSAQVYGFPCDVTDYIQVQKLWENAKSHFGRIDIWINNAGIATPMMKFWELSPEQYNDVVQTNIIGTMYGTRVALTGMLAQGYGALYNLEGFGARGRSMRGMTLYGSTKASVHFINRSLAQETEETSVIIGAIAPGMVITDMITRQFEGRAEELEKSKRILNIIAEKAETVAPVLADKILENQKNGLTIAYSSSARMMLKFLIAPFKKRDLFT
jgi:NAD(P)-dependent dehydrogenase (short-subunit alcohol dehydrogenase family)